jgi:hypothetical protein
MNDLAKKWNNTGLLDGLTDDIHKDECALVLEKTAQILVANDPNPTEKDGYKNWEDFCGFALPMARRIYDCLYPSRIKFPDVDWFVEDAHEFFNRNHELYNELANDHWTAGIDAGAEMCAMYEQVCLEKMNGQGK